MEFFLIIFMVLFLIFFWFILKTKITPKDEEYEKQLLEAKAREVMSCYNRNSR
ncbi:MAG: hypothetical protein INQ03_10360 [Candidatus Heimdallarchaeota archaeon]|nr:hypothetical protein [Candidatus Heimdallarchaeota archaeon]